MVLEWTLGLKRLAYSRIDLRLFGGSDVPLRCRVTLQQRLIVSAAASLYISSDAAAETISLCCSVTLHLKGTSEPPDILCESCACIIHTNLQS